MFGSKKKPSNQGAVVASPLPESTPELKTAASDAAATKKTVTDFVEGASVVEESRSGAESSDVLSARASVSAVKPVATTFASSEATKTHAVLPEGGDDVTFEVQEATSLLDLTKESPLDAFFLDLTERIENAWQNGEISWENFVKIF